MNLTRIRMAAGIVTCLVVLMAQSVDAKKKRHPVIREGEGMEAHIFRSAVDTKGHFTIDTTPVLPHLAFSVGLLLDFGFNGYFAVEQDKKIHPDLVDDDDEWGNKRYHQTMLNTYIDSRLMGNIGLADFLALGFQLPLVIPDGTVFGLNVSSTGVVDDERDGWSNSGGIGDIVFHLKARFLRADRHPLGIGALVAYQAPVGKSNFLTGDGGGGALTGKLILDVEPHYRYRFAINGGIHLPFGYSERNYLYQGCKTREDEDDSDCLEAVFDFGLDGADATEEDNLLFYYGPTATFGFGQSIVLWPGVLDFIIEIYGTYLLSSLPSEPTAYFSMEADAGFKLYIEKNSYLMAGYAHGLPVAGTSSRYGFQGMEHRAFIGFAFEPSIGDRDHDGIKDDVDQCPDDPEDRDDFEDTDGCPEPDNDRDGLLDVEDDCPLIPEDVDGDEDEDGCPEHGDDDRDGDGIIDELDSCPDDPEDFDQFEDSDGCPDPDNDKDGILDKDDMCPNDPEDMDGWEDKDGCPDPDNDNDRILDGDDQCPNEPETYNGKDDEDGCPDKGDVILTDTDIMILKKVYFEYDSATIKPISYNILDAVAATIKNNPQIDLIEVQGHADERGNDDYNLNLTDERAASVVRYLTNKMVDPGKLRSVGYGEYCPVDPNSNEAAWEKNRRVEFKVLSVNGRSTGVKPACEAAEQKGIGAGGSSGKKKKRKKRRR